VLRRRVQARMSRPGDLEAVHEAVRQDHRQGAGSVRRDRQGRLPEPRARRAGGLHPHEQHPAVEGAAGEDVRVDGRREAGAGRGQHPQRSAEHAERGARRPRHVVCRQPREQDHGQRARTRRPAAVRQGRRTGAAVAAQRRRRGGRRGAPAPHGFARRSVSHNFISIFSELIFSAGVYTVVRCFGLTFTHRQQNILP